MAETPTSVVVNIGSQRISMAVFDTSKSGKLILKSYGSESISGDPALDATRVSQTRIALTDLARRLKVGKTKVRYSISGQAVITRFVKLPPIDDDNVEQLVTFEAQQHIPFPINEVVWDYELIQGAAEKEAVLVAIKADALEEINTAVNDSGLETLEVDASPTALYNAFRASYGNLEEPVLLVDIGAKTSNLLYIEGNRFFTRSVPVGGAAVTAAIAKEYNISFADAEHQKVTNGLVALGGGHTEQLDEAIAALAMVIRNALTRLTSDVMRTTNFYRSQHGGSAPRQVFLAGSGASMPYTLEFFQEKLNLPVQFFNPLRVLGVGNQVDTEQLQKEAHTMGELVGLGLRAIGKATVGIDLVPSVVEQTRAADRRKPFLIAASAILLVGCAAWAGFQHSAAGKAADEAALMEGSRDNLAPRERQISSLLRVEDQLRDVADRFVSAQDDQAYWVDVIGELGAAFASDVIWLVNIEPLAGFNPLPADRSAANGAPVVKPDFANLGYGITGLADIRVEPQQAPQGRGARGAAPAAPSEPTINALRLTGLWRTNPRGPEVVSDVITRLRASGVAFDFTATDPDGQEVTLRDEQVLNITVAPSEAGELALRFDLTLPLSREVRIK